MALEPLNIDEFCKSSLENARRQAKLMSKHADILSKKHGEIEKIHNENMFRTTLIVRTIQGGLFIVWILAMRWLLF